MILGRDHVQTDAQHRHLTEVSDTHAKYTASITLNSAATMAYSPTVSAASVPAMLAHLNDIAV